MTDLKIQRDNQRKAVYAWERRARIFERCRSETGILSLDQCKALVEKLWDGYPTGCWYIKPPRVTPGRGCRRAIYRHDHVIHLPKWSRQPGVVVHEISHAILHSHNPQLAGHGPEFVRVYCELLVAHFGLCPEFLVAEMTNVEKGQRRVRMAPLLEMPWRKWKVQS